MSRKEYNSLRKELRELKGEVKDVKRRLNQICERNTVEMNTEAEEEVEWKGFPASDSD